MLLTESVALHGRREKEQGENPGRQAGSFTQTLLFCSSQHFLTFAGKAQIAVIEEGFP